MNITLDNWFDIQTCRRENVLWNWNLTHRTHILRYIGPAERFNNSNNNLFVVPDYQGIYSKDANKLMHNSCLHRQMPLIDKDTTQMSIMCPAHAWRYGLDGTCTHTPNINDGCERHLRSIDTCNVNGLIVGGDVARTLDDLLSKSRIAHLLDFSKVRYANTTSTEYNFNWKTFLEVYLELYHVKPVHGVGLGQYVDGSNFEWEFGDNWSCQIMGLSKQSCGISSKWYGVQQEVLSNTTLRDQNIGAIWILLYPNVMLEYYPHGMAVSTITPKFDDPTKCINTVDMFFDPNARAIMADILTEAYNEAASEDQHICEQIDASRKQMWTKGEVSVPWIFAPKHEPGIPAFYNWLIHNT